MLLTAFGLSSASWEPDMVVVPPILLLPGFFFPLRQLPPLAPEHPAAPSPG